MNTLTLICGIPNAGKTTYSETYDNVIHLDDFDDRLFRERFRKCSKKASEIGSDMCVDGCYHVSEVRMELLEMFRGKDFKKICIWINTPLETCLERSNRSTNCGIVKLIGNIFQPPTMEEGWDEIIVVTPDENRTAI